MILKIFYFIRTILFFRLRSIQYGGLPLIVGKHPVFHTKGKIIIGNHFYMRNLQFVSEIGAEKGATLRIGDHVFINQGCNICAQKEIAIDDYTQIGDCVTIYDTNYHEIDRGEGIKIKPVKVGKNVWIAARCILLPGVTIGDNSVVGCGSVVTKSFPNNVLIIGNPAKIVRELNVPDGYIRK
jgi:acetyltransferase-like isoleucine patch superfamily enzyme